MGKSDCKKCMVQSSAVVVAEAGRPEGVSLSNPSHSHPTGWLHGCAAGGATTSHCAANACTHRPPSSQELLQRADITGLATQYALSI